MADIKDMIIYYRNQKEWSQAELAKKLGVSPSTVGNYELGIRKPKPEIEEKLADLFNVSLDNLRGLDTERIPLAVPGTGELLDLFFRATPAQRDAVINLLRSFVSDQNNN